MHDEPVAHILCIAGNLLSVYHDVVPAVKVRFHPKRLQHLYHRLRVFPERDLLRLCGCDESELPSAEICEYRASA